MSYYRPSYTVAASQFGNTNPTFWINYIESAGDPVIKSFWRCVLHFEDTEYKRLIAGYTTNINVDGNKRKTSVNYLDERLSPDDDRLSVMIKGITFPSSKTVTDSLWFRGLEKKVPVSVDNCQEITLKILDNEDFFAHSIFLSWQQRFLNAMQYRLNEGIYYPATRSNYAQILGDSDAMGFGNTNSPNTSFQSDADGNLVNAAFNDKLLDLFIYARATGKPIMKVTGKNVYPTNIGSVELSHDSADLFEFSVTLKSDLFLYRRPLGRTQITDIDGVDDSKLNPVKYKQDYYNVINKFDGRTEEGSSLQTYDS